MATKTKQFRKAKSITGNYSIYQPVIPLSSFDKECHKPGRAKELEQCGYGGCKIRIPIDQDNCYICWRKARNLPV